MRIQRVREIISTKSSKIAICENLDPQKFSAIRYTRVCKSMQGHMKSVLQEHAKGSKNIQKHASINKSIQEWATYLVDFSVTDPKLVLSQFNSRLDLG